jgi:predicted esterase
MVKSAYIDFSFKGRYAILGTPSEEINELVYVLHGHGQLAQYFIRKFSGIAAADRLIVAPEGLSRYYLQGYTGRVGATWMTREDRETDIFNYITYLNTLHQQLMHRLSENIKITVLGFSQGAATASRWLMNGAVPAQRFILWAGILPFDMNIENAEEQLGDMEKIYIYGLDDPFVNQEKKDEMEKLSRKGNLRFREITFQGNHDIEPETLKNLFSPS